MKEQIQLRRILRFYGLAVLTLIACASEAHALRFGNGKGYKSYDRFYNVQAGSNWVEAGTRYHWYKGRAGNFDFQKNRHGDFFVKCKKRGNGSNNLADGSFMDSKSTYDTGYYQHIFYFQSYNYDQTHKTWAALWFFNRSSNAGDRSFSHYLEVDMFENYAPRTFNSGKEFEPQYNIYLNKYASGGTNTRRDTDGDRVYTKKHVYRMFKNQWESAEFELGVEKVNKTNILRNYEVVSIVPHGAIGLREAAYFGNENTRGIAKRSGYRTADLNMRSVVQNRPHHNHTRLNSYATLYVREFSMWGQKTTGSIY